MKQFQKGENRYYLENDQGETVAEITYVPSGDSMVIIDHTFVDDSLRGQGIAPKLVATVVEEMKQSGKKIVPVCSFAKAEFKRNKEYQEIQGTL
jgi:predicted GNAT family acetyltransferase